MKTSETRMSLDRYDIPYLLSLFEMICYNEYAEEMLHKDAEIKQKNAEAKPKGF